MLIEGDAGREQTIGIFNDYSGPPIGGLVAPASMGAYYVIGVLETAYAPVDGDITAMTPDVIRQAALDYKGPFTLGPEVFSCPGVDPFVGLCNTSATVVQLEGDKFNELTDWYLIQTKVKKLASFDRVKLALRNFNDVFGQTIVKNMRSIDLEEYQETRTGQGKAPATVDMEIKYAQAAVTKAFDNDLFSGEVLKAFRKTKKLLKIRVLLLTLRQVINLLKRKKTKNLAKNFLSGKFIVE